VTSANPPPQRQNLGGNWAPPEPRAIGYLVTSFFLGRRGSVLAGASNAILRFRELLCKPMCRSPQVQQRMHVHAGCHLPQVLLTFKMVNSEQRPREGPRTCLGVFLSAAHAALPSHHATVGRGSVMRSELSLLHSMPLLSNWRQVDILGNMRH